jgi:hypothetical protein
MRISNFIGQVKTKELARPSRFEVSFSAPAGLSEIYDNDVPTLRFDCESAQLPSRAIMTTDQKIYGYVEKFPYETSYSDAEFAFRIGDDMRVKKLFDAWLELVSPKSTYNLKYKSEYSREITVTQFSLTGEKTYQVKLLKAYPIAVSQLELDWSADGYHKLLVVFNYAEWKSIEV